MIHRGHVYKMILTDSSANEKSFTVNSLLLAEMLLPASEANVCVPVHMSLKGTHDNTGSVSQTDQQFLEEKYTVIEKQR